MLCAASLASLFGKFNNLERLILEPVLLRKGQTRLAMYGMGAIRDERLYRLFEASAVKFLRPEQDTQEDWFNLMLLHQNRVKRSGPTSYLPESFLPDFLDLLIWGHEHECRLEPELNDERQFFVSQPGSSVATSLCDGETKAKHVGLLQIRGKKFKMEAIP